MPNGEIIPYQPDSSIRLEVRMEEDTVWLNRQQMARLFDRDVKTIGKHINNALKEELSDYPGGCVKSGAPSFFLQKSPNIGGLGLCRVKDFCIFAP